jgi:hypothetical protein
MAILGADIVAVIATAVVYGTEKIQDSRSYKIPLAVQIAVPGTLAMLTPLIKESPAWLPLRGRTDDARNVLLHLRGNNEELVQAEMLALEDFVRGAEIQKEVHFWEIFSKDNLINRNISKNQFDREPGYFVVCAEISARSLAKRIEGNIEHIVITDASNVY